MIPRTTWWWQFIWTLVKQLYRSLIIFISFYLYAPTYEYLTDPWQRRSYEEEEALSRRVSGKEIKKERKKWFRLVSANENDGLCEFFTLGSIIYCRPYLCMCVSSIVQSNDRLIFTELIIVTVPVIIIAINVALYFCQLKISLVFLLLLLLVCSIEWR